MSELFNGHDDLNELIPQHDLEDLVPENQRVEIQVHMVQAEIDKAIQEMSRRFFEHDARLPLVRSPQRHMSDRIARRWLSIINFVSRRWVRHLPYRWLGRFNTWIEDWGNRNGLWAAAIRIRPTPEFHNGGGYLLPIEVAKSIFYYGSFMRYWEMEGQDLRQLVKRLEGYQRK